MRKAKSSSRRTKRVKCIRNRKTGQIITRNADMVGSPSPTFDEGITGQDGPSADPTNQTFEVETLPLHQETLRVQGVI